MPPLHFGELASAADLVYQLSESVRGGACDCLGGCEIARVLLVVYKQTFAFGRYGYGTALSLILTVLITVLALAQLAVLRARENRL